MTFKELLEACGNGEMPRVRSHRGIGQVTEIKNNPQAYGFGVYYNNGMGHIWYDAEPKNNNGIDFMRDLELVEWEISHDQWRKHV